MVVVRDRYNYDQWKKRFFNQKISIDSKNPTKVQLAFQVEARKMQAREGYLLELQILE